jgi:hypothetical protein
VPTKFPVQWVPGSLSPGIKRLGREADSSSQIRGAIRPLLAWGQRSQYDNWSMGCTILSSNPATRMRFSPPPKRPDRLCGPPSLLSNGCPRSLSWDYSGPGVKLTTHLHLLPKLAMKEWNYTPSPPTRLDGVHRNSFTFTFIPPLPHILHRKYTNAKLQ